MSDLFNSIKEIFQLVRQYLVNAQGQPNLLGKILRTLFIVIIIKFMLKFIYHVIDRLGEREEKPHTLSSRRAATIRSTMKSIIKVLFYFYGAMMILELFKIDTKSIIATAGIGGVAIGFGAQSLVKDVITGFFILQDNLYVVGDYVKIKGLEGHVEELGLRITKIRDLSGDLHIIPNGQIQVISNLSRGAIRALIYVDIAYEEDINQAVKVLQKVCDNINIEYDDIITKNIYIRGVEDLGDSGIRIRMEGMVKNMKHWDIERAVRKSAKEAFDREGIEIPYPRLVVYRGDED